MSGEICPIFDRQSGEKITLVGMWLQHPSNVRLIPNGIYTPELRHIASMVESFVTNESTKVVPNTEIDLGAGCKFIGGGFVMGENLPAPNEIGGRPHIEYEYEMKDNGGVTICVRES